jgi:threonine 3-dehydrogenase
MKALVKSQRKPGLWLEDVPVPKFSDHEVLIKPRKTAICGTDVHIYKWDAWAQKTVPVPMVVGHEFMGEIVEVGRHVTFLKPGDLVSGEGHLTCGVCRNCREGMRHLCPNTRGVGYHTPGCFGEYFALPAENVFKLPEGISEDLASIFDPYGNAVHTALSFSLVGEDVLITGAGPIGIMSAVICKHAGARNVIITDMNEYRLNLARKLGVTHAINIKEKSIQHTMDELNIDNHFNIGLEMSGSPHGLKDLLENVQMGGNIGLLGILPPGTAIDWDLVIFKLLKIKGIWGREIFGTWHKMTSMIQSGLDISPIITHKFKIDDYEKGFETMMSGNSGKIILDWT